MRKWLLPILFVAAPLGAQVTLTRAADRISVQIDGKPFTDFYVGGEAPKPYLHPLWAASGVIVTRRFPMEKVAGENTNNPHQRGVWFTHGDVNGIDFWTNEPPDKKRTNQGRLDLNKVVSMKDGDRSGSLVALFDWAAPDKKVLLTESRTMVFHAEPELRTVDFDITLTAVEKVKFADTKEGGFGIRVAAGLEAPARNAPVNPPRTGKLVDSEGREAEAGVWGKRASWVDMSGEVEGQKVGVTVMDHPSNAHYPAFWHCRAYGLCAANIFGAHDFMNDPAQDASMTLVPGQKLRFRYRIVIHPGDPKTAGVAELYKVWAATK